MNGMNRMFVRDQRESEPAERMFLVSTTNNTNRTNHESPSVPDSPHHSSNSCYSWLTKGAIPNAYSQQLRTRWRTCRRSTAGTCVGFTPPSC